MRDCRIKTKKSEKKKQTSCSLNRDLHNKTNHINYKAGVGTSGNINETPTRKKKFVSLPYQTRSCLAYTNSDTKQFFTIKHPPSIPIDLLLNTSILQNKIEGGGQISKKSLSHRIWRKCC